jgi:Phasin protein
MPEQESHDQTQTAFSPLAMQGFAAVQKRFETFAQGQSELAKKVGEINRFWSDRGQSEAGLASELASKLTAAHSLPEAMSAWQEWSRQRMERMAEDGKHLLTDVQEVMKTSARLLSNGGGWTNGPGGHAS